MYRMPRYEMQITTEVTVFCTEDKYSSRSISTAGSITGRDRAYLDGQPLAKEKRVSVSVVVSEPEKCKPAPNMLYATNKQRRVCVSDHAKPMATSLPTKR